MEELQHTAATANQGQPQTNPVADEESRKEQGDWVARSGGRVYNGASPMEALATPPEQTDCGTLGGRLQQARLEEGWTRAELARRSGYKSTETIRRYEEELVHAPREAILIHLAQVLRVSPAWLILGRGDQRQRRPRL
jgi:ribosome-binding protein aMBF1 (putative translation factor)